MGIRNDVGVVTEDLAGSEAKSVAEAADEDARLEREADRLLAEHGMRLDGAQLYTQKGLLQKITRELRRLPEAEPDGLSARASEFLMGRFIQSRLDSAGLSGARRSVYALRLRGLTISEIAALTGLSRQCVLNTTSLAKRKDRRSSDRYAGLHEVYWREVRRYVYRKPRRGRVTGNG